MPAMLERGFAEHYTFAIFMQMSRFHLGHKNQ